MKEILSNLVCALSVVVLTVVIIAALPFIWVADGIAGAYRKLGT